MTDEVEQERLRIKALEDKRRELAEIEGRKNEELRRIREQRAEQEGLAIKEGQNGLQNGLQEGQQEGQQKGQQIQKGKEKSKQENLEISQADPFLLARDTDFVTTKELNSYRNNENRILSSILKDPKMKKELNRLLALQKNEMKSLVAKVSTGKPVSYERLYEIEEKINDFANYFASQAFKLSEPENVGDLTAVLDTKESNNSESEDSESEDSESKDSESESTESLSDSDEEQR